MGEIGIVIRGFPLMTGSGIVGNKHKIYFGFLVNYVVSFPAIDKLRT